MRRLWDIVAVLAVANLLAMGGFAAWLASTGRVDRARLLAVRDLLATPTAEEDKAEEEPPAESAGADRSGAEPDVPLVAADVLALRVAQGEADRQRVELLRQQVEQLRWTLAQERAALDEERRAFQRERDAFEAERARIAETEGSAQFRKAVETLSAMSPKAAKGMLQAMITDATGAIDDAGADLATAYLNAMDGMTRTAVLEAFQKDAPDLAAELLNRLRTHGVLVRAEAPDG